MSYQSNLVPDCECAQSCCANVTTGCWGVCYLKANPVPIVSGLIVSQPPAAVAPEQVQADLTPKRAAFIAWCESRGMEADEDHDAWGKRKFKHPHIESMWYGWFHAPAPDAGARDAALEEAAAMCESQVNLDVTGTAITRGCAAAIRMLKSQSPAQHAALSDEEIAELKYAAVS